MTRRISTAIGQAAPPVNVKAGIPAGLTAIPASNLTYADLRKGDLVYRNGVDRGEHYEHLMRVLDVDPEVRLEWVASVDPNERGGAGRVPAAEKQDPLLRGTGEVTIYRKPGVVRSVVTPIEVVGGLGGIAILVAGFMTKGDLGKGLIAAGSAAAGVSIYSAMTRN